jgi:hypothetical protein
MNFASRKEFEANEANQNSPDEKGHHKSHTSNDEKEQHMRHASRDEKAHKKHHVGRSKHNRQLQEEYGGEDFNSLESYRRLVGDNETSDADVWKLIAGDTQEQNRIAEKNRREAEQKMQAEQARAEAERARADAERIRAEGAERERRNKQTELETERSRSRLYGNLLDPFSNTHTIANIYGRPSYSSSTSRYLEKEQLKKELKDELDNEKKWKAVMRKSLAPPKPTTRKKSRSRSRSKGKKKVKGKKK